MAAIPRWIATVAGLALVGGLTLYLKAHDPGESPDRFVPCISQKITGLYCSGCGSTRAAHELLNLNILAACQKNIAFVVAIPFIVVGGTVVWSRWMFPEKRFWYESVLRKISKAMPIWVLLVIIVYGLIRNIPTEPFSFLMPRG